MAKVITKLFMAFTASAVISQAYARPAYYMSEFQPTDPETMRTYSANVQATFEPFGGRFIARGAEADVKEGMGAMGRIVLIKFDSLENAQKWYNSERYAQLRQIRWQSGNTRAMIFEGLEEN